MNQKKNTKNNGKNSRRAFTAMLVAALALGGAGLAAAFMLNNESAPVDNAPAGLALPGQSGAASAPPGNVASVPVAPQADLVVVPQTCESGADPTTGKYNACVETYNPNVIKTSSTQTNGNPRCWYGNGNGADYAYTYENVTTNQPANATYTAYEGTVAHADATQKSGNHMASSYGYSWCQTYWGAYFYSQYYYTASDSGSSTDAPVTESGLSGAVGVPAANVDFSQQNVTHQYGWNSCSYVNEPGYYSGGCDNGKSQSANQDTSATAATSGANAGLSQANDSSSGQDSWNGCGSYGCYSGNSASSWTDQHTTVGATAAPTAVTPGYDSVSGGQWNYTYRACYPNYCYGYSYRATGVRASTSPVPVAGLSTHNVWVGQYDSNGQGCTMSASVDGVNYLSYVPDGTTCPATVPDVPQAPQVSFPVPGQLPNAGVPLPPLPPVVLPPLPSGLPPLPQP